MPLREEGSTGARLTPVALDRKAETARLIIAKYRSMMAGRAAAAAVSGQESGRRGRVDGDGLP